MLTLPEQITFEALLQGVSLAHGKPVVIREVPGHVLSGVSGLWVESAHRSLVLVRSGLSELHRMHVICHEFGHILLQHQGCEGLAASMPSVFNHVGRTKGIKRMLARSPQWNDMEKAAEEVAYRLSGFVLAKPTVPGSDFEKVFG
ncbi:hypothetical protein [Arthrobacter cavernae]|uniref:IrrE N-terminal-like domain-containing protein n=1 Tax=Arthrobacter cavernae TaxID=2817681 RepID=A0A939HHT2_9MICC|nr:hypothetical protein [Arthrobacter cavernae]MBO1269509.1 hypothetical protein [Arthrobacter cavernae]